MRGWWEEPETFKVKKDQDYQVAGLRKVYKLVATMLCRMYGHPYATIFSGSWVSLMYFVTIHGTHFNWANLLIAALKTSISVALAPEEGYSSKFYMASYMLDAVCARCHFEGWEHNWDQERGHLIHKELQVFWDSKYE